MAHELLRPRALVGHLVVLAMVATCVGLGLWQLDRLGRIRADNQRAAERLEAPTVDLAALADPASSAPVDVAALEYRPVVVTGVYRPHEEVLQRGQEHLRQAGFHVLTPLELSGGGVVLVRRGWVPPSLDEPPVAEAPPPEGTVTVTGVLERPVEQPGFGARDPDEGRLARVFHTDTARLDRQVEGRLFPLVLRVDTDPATVAHGTLPIPPGPPILDERNHLSYAVQWFTFAVIALATYVAWLVTRRRAGRAGARRADPGGAEAPGEPRQRADADPGRLR